MIKYPHGTLEVYRSLSLNPKERWRWRFVHRNTEKVGQSPGGYLKEAEALRLGRKLVEGKYTQEGGIDVEVDAQI